MVVGSAVGGGSATSVVGSTVVGACVGGVVGALVVVASAVVVVVVDDGISVVVVVGGSVVDDVPTGLVSGGRVSERGAVPAASRKVVAGRGSLACWPHPTETTATKKSARSAADPDHARLGFRVSILVS